MNVTRETFVNMPMDNKMEVVFDVLTEIYNKQGQLEGEIGKCNNVIANRKKTDTTVAGFMGFVGGLVGFFSHAMFGK